MSWSVPREWSGETAFIIAGGPSVTQEDVDLLRGRRVVAVNSSWQKAPWADYLLFGDARWWVANKKKVRDGFQGKIVTVARIDDRNILRLVKSSPPGLAAKPTHVTMRRTSLHPAINLLAHQGVARIVLLGADMRPAPDGRTHHHEPHMWPTAKGCWTEMMRDLETTTKPLEKLGVEVVNCSMVSLIKWWPKRLLRDCL